MILSSCIANDENRSIAYLLSSETDVEDCCSIALEKFVTYDRNIGCGESPQN